MSGVQRVPLEDDRLLTAAELAKILGVDKKTIGLWVRDGKIPSKLIGRKTRRFLRSEVELWLQQASQGGA